MPKTIKNDIQKAAANNRFIKTKKAKVSVKMDNVAGKAILLDGKISPRKIGLMVDAIRGKTVQQAQRVLIAFEYKKSATILSKLLKSAMSNAVHNNKYREEDVAVCRVDSWVGKGMMLRRMEPRARGSGNRIQKVYSNVWLYLRTNEEKK